MSTASIARVCAQDDSPVEEWYAILGYEGRYQVSNLGRVWSLISGKPLAAAPQSKGYLTVSLYDGSVPKRPRSHCVHDLVAAACHGPKPLGCRVDHIDTDKQNNRATNLEYVTAQENTIRAEAFGLIPHPRGEAHPNSKLSDLDAATIRRLGKKQSTAVIARLYGVTESTICTLLRGESYKSA